MKTTHFYLLAAVLFISMFSVTPGYSVTLPTPHTWKVSLPADSPYDRCTIVFYADHRNQDSGQLTVTRGGSTVSWQSFKQLSYVIG